MNAVVCVLCAAIGFGSAWWVQSVRWSESDAVRDKAISDEIFRQTKDINQKLIDSQADTEKARYEYLEYQRNAKAEIDDLERRVSAGPERLYVKAKCPAVPATETNASRTPAGTAELDATATGYYLALERGLADQYGLLQLCRKELKARSAPE